MLNYYWSREDGMKPKCQYCDMDADVCYTIMDGIEDSWLYLCTEHYMKFIQERTKKVKVNE
jgi:hypothetical protein